MIVVKFGGTSLADAGRMRAAAAIVKRHAEAQKVVVVVSAMAGVTDDLFHLGEHPGDDSSPLLDALRTRHDRTFDSLNTHRDVELSKKYATTWEALARDLARLDAPVVQSAASGREDVAIFSAYGERFSVVLFSAALQQEGLLPLPFTGEPVVCIGSSNEATAVSATVEATRLWLETHSALGGDRQSVPVLPGYVARREDGSVTTLGRNASDYSAAVIGAALGAEAVYIYSDVAGIHVADPHVVPSAPLLRQLSYDEASAIVSLGAKVVHPEAIRVLAARNIPLRLRSALHPEAPGTDIMSLASRDVCGSAVTGSSAAGREARR